MNCCTKTGLAAALLALACVLTAPGTAAAHDPLRCEIKKMAEKLRDFFTGQRTLIAIATRVAGTLFHPKIGLM